MRVNNKRRASTYLDPSHTSTLQFRSEPTSILSAIDNDSLAKRYPSIAPDCTKTKDHHSLRIQRQTFTTLNEKVEKTKERPTMGGKTPYSVKHRYTDNSQDTHTAVTGRKRPPSMLKQHTIPSSNELKLLSRRIDPHQPLSSPHDTPKKPPLPNVLKRKFDDIDYQIVDAENMPPTANASAAINSVEMDTHKKQKKGSFTCQQCNKVYKTKNGLVYHHERCKSNKHLPQPHQQPLPTNDNDVFVECSVCETTLLKNDTLHYQSNDTTIVCAQCINNTAPNSITNDSNSTELDLFNNVLIQPDILDNALLAAEDDWNLDFSNGWTGIEDPPSLLFSSSSEMFSSALMEDEDTNNLCSNSSFAFNSDADWFQFANFEADFVNVAQDEEDNTLNKHDNK